MNQLTLKYSLNLDHYYKFFKVVRLSFSYEMLFYTDEHASKGEVCALAAEVEPHLINDVYPNLYAQCEKLAIIFEFFLKYFPLFIFVHESSYC